MDPKLKDNILEIFLQEISCQLGSHLKQVILFGSRARGNYTPDSDYDCLLVLDVVSPITEKAINKVSGEMLYEYDVVFSIFFVTEKQFQQQQYEPLFMNIRKEGIVL